MRTKTNSLAVGLLIASFLLLSNLNTSSASAATASITTNTDITLNASSAGNGVSIDEESIGITTTCSKGYDLTIATSTSTDLYLNGDSTKTAAYTAVDGTSALDSTNNTNKWGYTLTNDATSSTVFSPLSTTASSIRNISETTNITSETIPVYYGIKTDSTIDPGTYTMGNNGTIVYYLTMNPLCDVVDVVYDGNNADEGTMGAVYSGVKDGDTIDLVASNFSRQGYGFAGWSFDPDAGTKLLDSDNTNNPIVYGPQETITLPEGFMDNDTDYDGIVKLYAVWLQSQGNLQGWAGCTNLDTATYDTATGKLDLTKNSVTALTDQRDNDTYAVARLADGQCWMIENLRLDNDATLTTNNTNNPFNDGTNVTLKHNYTDTATSNTLSPNSNVAYDATSSPNGWCTDPSAACTDQSRLRTDNTSDRATYTSVQPVTTQDTNTYSYGNYYNWYSATAGNGTYSVNANNNSTTGDLCPAGWHLPKGGDKSNEANNEFWSLVVTGINRGVKPANYDSSTKPYYTGSSEGAPASGKLRSYPNNYLYAGYASGASLVNRGQSGYYWSSTAHLPGNAYYLFLNNSDVDPGTYDSYKYNGRPVRCVASTPTSYTLTYDATTGTGAPEAQTIMASGIASFTISDTVPTRSGYTFAGWTDDTGNTYQPSDTYTTREANTTLQATWTHSYYIAYNINTTDTNAEGTMGIQTQDDSGADLLVGAQITLLASNFSRTGYGFAGWSLDPNAATNTSAKIYGPQETISAPLSPVNGDNGEVTLYAVWVQSAGSIQDETTVSNVCDSLTTAPTDDTANITSVSALTDQRDNNTYAIAKLADGNCWMIENLRLDAENTRTPEKQALAQGYGTSATYGNFSGLADSESTNFVNTTAANSLYYSGTQSGSATINIGTSDYPDYRIPRYNGINTPTDANNRPQNPSSNVFAESDTNPGMYSYGNYYNWHAAIADLGYHGTVNQSATSTSLCPAGWRLPKGGHSTVNPTSELYLLGKAVMDNAEPDQDVSIGTSYYSNQVTNNNGKIATAAVRSYPNNFLYSGYYDASSSYNRGVSGDYWSSTSGGALTGFYMYLGSTGMRPGTANWSKFYGFAIRCVAGS